VDTWLIWGHRHVRDAQRYLLQTCFGGRLQAVSGEMKALVSRHANRGGEAYSMTRWRTGSNRLPKMVVRRRVKKVGSGGQAIQPPGDIDVLAFNTLTRTRSMCWNARIWPLRELLLSSRQRLRGLTESTPHHKSIIQKHQRRVQWVRENLAHDPGLGDALMEGNRGPCGPPSWSTSPVMSPKLRNLGEAGV
jgi:hypothetical protein